MWLYNKLLNSRFQWLSKKTSVYKVGNKLYYRVFGITVHKEEISMLEWRQADMSKTHKPCYGKCERCVWKYNGGCSEWNLILVPKEKNG